MLNSLENFVSINGAIHYELPFNTQKINLRKKNSPIKFKNFLTIKNLNIKIFKPPFNVFWEIEKVGE